VYFLNIFVEFFKIIHYEDILFRMFRFVVVTFCFLLESITITTRTWSEWFINTKCAVNQSIFF